MVEVLCKLMEIEMLAHAMAFEERNRNEFGLNLDRRCVT